MGLSKGGVCQLANFKGLCGLENWTVSPELKTRGCPANSLHFLRFYDSQLKAGIEQRGMEPQLWLRLNFPLAWQDVGSE